MQRSEMFPLMLFNLFVKILVILWFNFNDNTNMLSLLGPHLISKTGTISSVLLESSPLILFYFSASWCPPCRQFTPVLVDFYNKVNTPSRQAEIVLVSADRSEKDFKEYYDKMPWLALPYENQSVKQFISEKYKIQSIPSLILTDKEGFVLNSNCRNEVVSNGVNAIKHWQELVEKAKVKDS